MYLYPIPVQNFLSDRLGKYPEGQLWKIDYVPLVDKKNFESGDIIYLYIQIQVLNLLFLNIRFFSDHKYLHFIVFDF